MVYIPYSKRSGILLENEECPFGNSGLEAPSSLTEIGGSQYDGEKC